MSTIITYLKTPTQRSHASQLPTHRSRPLINSFCIPAPTPTPPPHRILARQTTVSSASESVPTGEFITTKVITIPGATNPHVTIPEKTIQIAIPTCIQIIIPDTNGYVPPGTCGALYEDYPNFAAVVVASVVFGILSVVHIMQAAVFKKVRFVVIKN